MSKKYFSPTVMRPLSLAHFSVSVNVCKQTTREMPEATCTGSTIVDYLHEKPLIWVISMGRDIMASLLPLVTHSIDKHHFYLRPHNFQLMVFNVQ